jgi:DNA-binding NarL/FixJ family response regulator
VPLSRSMVRRLHEAQEQVDEAIQAREDAIVAAYEAGGSLYEIANEVGYSHVGISKMLARLGVRRRDMTLEEMIADDKRRGAR